MAAVSNRLEQLETELTEACNVNRRQAKSFHFWMMFLTGLTIAASAAAGLLGLGFGVDTRVVGAVALVPGIAASIIQQFRLPAKIDFHYRYWDALKAMIRKVQYGLPEKPSADDLLRISEELSALEARMTAQWQQVVGSTSPERQLPASQEPRAQR